MSNILSVKTCKNKMHNKAARDCLLSQMSFAGWLVLGKNAPKHYNQLVIFLKIFNILWQKLVQ